VLIEDVARRTGLNDTTDAYPVLVGTTVMAGIRAAISRWGAGDGRTSLPELVHESFVALRNGLAAPEPFLPSQS